MAEIEKIETEYTAKLGNAGNATIRYSGPPLSALSEEDANFVRGIMTVFEELENPVKDKS